jgi:hypothetical protein
MRGDYNSLIYAKVGETTVENSWPVPTTRSGSRYAANLRLTLPGSDEIERILN